MTKLLQLAEDTCNKLTTYDYTAFQKIVGPALAAAITLVVKDYIKLKNQLRSGKAILPDFVPEYRHTKTNGTYCTIFDRDVMLESTWKPAVLYMNAEGVLVVREKTEFYDGRFEKLSEEEVRSEATNRPVQKD